MSFSFISWLKRIVSDFRGADRRANEHVVHEQPRKALTIDSSCFCSDAEHKICEVLLKNVFFELAKRYAFMRYVLQVGKKKYKHLKNIWPAHKGYATDVCGWSGNTNALAGW